MDRRTLLKSTLATSTVFLAAAAGLLKPGKVMAAYPKAAFEAKDTATALNGLHATGEYEQSDQVTLEAPDFANNGATVPIKISTTLNDVEAITLLAESNQFPLVGSFNLHRAEPYISTRIKMAQTGNIIAVVKSAGKLYGNSIEIRVVIGGCTSPD